MADQPHSGAVALPAGSAEDWAVAPRTPRRVVLGRLARRNPVGVIALLFVLAFIALGIVQTISHEMFNTAVAPHDPKEILLGPQLQGPSADYWFGTNQKGQDMFSRILAGARISFLIGTISVVFGFVPGAFLGIVSGYYQRWLDYIIQRSGEAWSAFPILFLYLAFITAFGQGLKTISIVIIISALFGGSRVLRAVSLLMKQNEFVHAARSLGASEVHILFKHVIPNVMPIIIVGASSVFAVSVLAESALSFLGIGVAPGTPSWGIDLNEGLDKARFYPYLVIFPGIAISIVVLGFNLLGDTLRDVLDPRLRGTLN